MAFQADLSQSKWHGMPAWCLQSDHLRVITVPATGAKITSIKDRAAGHEWLVTPHTRPFKALTYGSNFGDQDMTGWDEMYPTIDICPYPVEGPWHGVTLPDHGEVWALPWDVSKAEAGRLTLSVEGRALPYRLERTLSLVDTRTLRLDYRVTNTGPEPQAGFWTAHPQFAADDDTRILLPDDVEQVVSVHPGDLGKPGDLHPWPDTKTVSGDIKRLDRIWPAEPASSRKIYAQPDQPLSWAALKQADTGNWLRLDWDPKELPYMGMWVDEGRLIDGERTIRSVALEPTNGYYDLLSLAWKNKRVPVIPPGETLAWSVRIQVGQD